MKRFAGYFLQGLLYVAPLAITGYIIYVIFVFVDGILKTYIYDLIHKDIPGMGILVLIVIITILGFLGQTIIAQPFKSFISRLLNRAPIIKMIYTSFKDLLLAFAGKDKKFNHPVMVKVNKISNLEKIGFITQDDLSVIGKNDLVAVYFPLSYTFSGELYLVPKQDIRPLNLSGAEAMKFIASGGVAGWETEKRETE